MINPENQVSQKQIKNNKNQEKLQVHISEGNKVDGDHGAQSELRTNLLNNHLTETSFKQIQEIFAKSQEMKELAKTKNQELEKEFADLKERLTSSSEYLQKIKKNIDNLKFSYQKSMLEMNKSITINDNFTNLNREDMKKSMEEIRKKIDNLQSKVKDQKEKQETVTNDYKSAFEKVLSTLQDIENGTYSSQILNDNLGQSVCE